jgi:dTDP-4-dehydrorhamnose 3,5-epimerase
MEFLSTSLKGVVLIRSNRFEDHRGLFVKPFHSQLFSENGPGFQPREEFFSVSKAGVIRGMHFQVPPSEQWKLVFCVYGRLFDVVLDLRRGEPTFGQHLTMELNTENSLCLLIPPGLAHGFCSLKDDSILYYSASTVYDPVADRGVRWDSFGVDWPVSKPIISERDVAFPSLAEYDSPF